MLSGVGDHLKLCPGSEHILKCCPVAEITIISGRVLEHSLTLSIGWRLSN